MWPCITRVTRARSSAGGAAGPVQTVRVMSVVPSGNCAPLSIRYTSFGRIARLVAAVTR
jgi:hypothetical protein